MQHAVCTYVRMLIYVRTRLCEHITEQSHEVRRHPVGVQSKLRHAEREHHDLTIKGSHVPVTTTLVFTLNVLCLMGGDTMHDMQTGSCTSTMAVRGSPVAAYTQ